MAGEADIITNSYLGKKLCEKLGIDPDHVAEINIRIGPDQNPATAMISYALSESDCTTLLDAIKEARFIAHGEADDETMRKIRAKIEAKG